jgi:hypothetical protein
MAGHGVMNDHASSRGCLTPAPDFQGPRPDTLVALPRGLVYGIVTANLLLENFTILKGEFDEKLAHKNCPNFFPRPESVTITPGVLEFFRNFLYDFNHALRPAHL